MEPKIIKRLVSNSGEILIPVEYVVIHSSSGPLSRVLDVFNDKNCEKSCHFIIDEDGSIYQTLEIKSNCAVKGWHSGRSLMMNDNGKIISEFNEYSLGIELLNKNCNVYPYSNNLLESLIRLVFFLKMKFPSLNDPNRVIGHEQISGFRGKVDPGHMFDWKWFYNTCYDTDVYKSRKPNMSDEFRDLLQKIQTTSKENGVDQKNIDIILKEMSLFYQKNLGVSPLPF